MIPDKSLLLPNERERQQIFHLLKRYSSWTAWNRIREYFKKFADITEESVRQADNSGLLHKTYELCKTSITYNDYIDITQAYALFDEGVRRLGKGDKRVFTYDEANGFFARAMVITEHYSTAKRKLDYEEISWKKGTPLMKEFFDTLGEMTHAWRECGSRILEPRSLDQPAYTRYDLWHAVYLPKLSYPDHLPEVPEPKNVFVKTGEEVPCSGIWEPVKEGMERLGAMHYLHGGVPAPKATLTYKKNSDRELGYSAVPTNVIWRLIWCDDRYKDGTVPEEEQDYRFDLPTSAEESPFKTDVNAYLERHKLPHPFLDDYMEPPPQGVVNE